MRGLILRSKRLERLRGRCHRRFLASALLLQNRKQCLGEARQVPERNAGLVPVGIAPVAVDGTEHRGWIVRLHEGAWAVVDGLAGNRHVVSVHYAMDEAEKHPLRDEL